MNPSVPIMLKSLSPSFLIRCPHPLVCLVRERRLATEAWMHQGKPLIRRYCRQHMPGPWCTLWLQTCQDPGLHFAQRTEHILISLQMLNAPLQVFLLPYLPLPPSQTTSSALKGAIQLGIGYTVGNLSSKPERDVLMQDFYVVESIFFPRYTQVHIQYITSAHVDNTILMFVAGVDHYID